MESDATTPVADAADAQPVPAPEESASATPSPSDSGHAFMNAMIRGEAATAAATSSNPDAARVDADEADAATGEPAPSGDAKPMGRRASKAAEAAARIAELEARVAELSPVPPDASEEARKAILDAEDRYRRLLAKPDDDGDWSQDDYVWLQDEKRRRALVPDITRHFETVVERERRVARETVEAERNEFWQRVGQDLAAAGELPGVDLDSLKAAPSFADRDRLVYAAGRAAGAGELRALRDELADAKRQLLGIARPPLSGGRSSPGQTFDPNDFMNNLMRGARA